MLEVRPRSTAPGLPPHLQLLQAVQQLCLGAGFAGAPPQCCRRPRPLGRRSAAAPCTAPRRLQHAWRRRALAAPARAPAAAAGRAASLGCMAHARRAAAAAGAGRWRLGAWRPASRAAAAHAAGALLLLLLLLLLPPPLLLPVPVALALAAPALLCLLQGVQQQPGGCDPGCSTLQLAWPGGYPARVGPPAAGRGAVVVPLRDAHRQLGPAGRNCTQILEMLQGLLPGALLPLARRAGSALQRARLAWRGCARCGRRRSCCCAVCQTAPRRQRQTWVLRPPRGPACGREQGLPALLPAAVSGRDPSSAAVGGRRERPGRLSAAAASATSPVKDAPPARHGDAGARVARANTGLSRVLLNESVGWQRGREPGRSS